MCDLGVGFARGINNLGEVVGYKWGKNSDNSSTNHAFLYSGGVMSDLNSLVKNLPTGIGDLLVAAAAINDRGQIIANSLDSHAFLLTPVAPQVGADLLLLD